MSEYVLLRCLDVLELWMLATKACCPFWFIQNSSLTKKTVCIYRSFCLLILLIVYEGKMEQCVDVLLCLAR